MKDVVIVAANLKRLVSNSLSKSSSTDPAAIQASKSLVFELVSNKVNVLDCFN